MVKFLDNNGFVEWKWMEAVGVSRLIWWVKASGVSAHKRVW